jgi:hypothetical protein
MDQHETSINTSEKSLEMLFSALTAEYESTRVTSRSRDHLLGSLMNFMIVIISGAIAALPTILEKGLYFVLLLISIFLSALTMHYLWQGRLILTLASYENDFLRPKLASLFKAMGYAENIPRDTYELWQWQTYLAQTEARGSLYDRFVRGLTRAGTPLLSTLVSVGCLLSFIYYRGVRNLPLLELSESVLLIIAGGYCLALVLVVMSRGLNVICEYLRG